MDSKVKEAMIASQMAKDKGEHAWFGALAASRRKHKQHLRKNRLGRFAKGKH